MWQLYIHNIQVNTPNFKDRLQLIKPMITPYVLIFGSRSHISWNENKDVNFTEMSFFILRLNNWAVLTHEPRLYRVCSFFTLELKSCSWNGNKDVDFTEMSFFSFVFELFGHLENVKLLNPRMSYKFLAHLSQRLISELIVYPWSGVRRRHPSSVRRPSSTMLKHLLLRNRLADQILCGASLGRGERNFVRGI